MTDVTSPTSLVWSGLHTDWSLGVTEYDTIYVCLTGLHSLMIIPPPKTDSRICKLVFYVFPTSSNICSQVGFMHVLYVRQQLANC